MLTDSDRLLIEKYLDFNQVKHPDAKDLTQQEKELWEKRIQDQDFQEHLELSDKVNDFIIKEADLRRFKNTLKKVAKEYQQQKEN